MRLGDFVIYGKVAAMRATAKDGVAQLINDHSAIFAPEKRGSLLADAGGARGREGARRGPLPRRRHGEQRDAS